MRLGHAIEALWTSLENALDDEASSGSPLWLTAENHNGSGPEIVLLVDPQFPNFGTVKKKEPAESTDLVVML